MLRYIKMVQQNVTEFCCSRAVFHRVNIPITTMHNLFDNNFIYNTFDKFKRPSNIEIQPLRTLCSKCEGFGFYDWVSRLTEDGEDEFVRSDMGHPLIVKNENPISVIYVSTWSGTKICYYPTNFNPTQLTYRCENCFGCGIPISNRENFRPITIDDLKERPLEQVSQDFQKQSIFNRTTTYIKGMYNNATSKRISQRV